MTNETRERGNFYIAKFLCSIMFSLAKDSLIELERSSKEIKRKMENGFPVITIKTVIRNRYRELGEVFGNMLRENGDEDKKLELLNQMLKKSAEIKKDYKNLGFSLEQYEKTLIDEIRVALYEGKILRRGHRALGLHEMIAQIIISGEIDFSDFAEKEYKADPALWIAKYSEIYRNLEMQLDLLTDTDFIKLDSIIVILNRLLDGVQFLQIKLETFDFDHYLAHIEELEQERSVLFLRRIFDTYISEYHCINRFFNRLTPTALDYITKWHDYRYFYELLNEWIVRFAKLLNLIQTKTGDYSSYAPLMQLLTADEGESALIKKLQSYVDLQSKANELFVKIDQKAPSQENRRNLELINLAMEETFQRDNFRNTVTRDAAPFIWEIRFTLVATYLLSKFIIADFYDTDVVAVKEIDENLWYYAENTPINSMTFGTLLMKLYLFSDLGTKMKNKELISLAVGEYTRLSTKFKTAAPYYRISALFFINMFELITERKNVDEAFSEINQALLVESAFIPSERVKNQIQMYLEYLNEYERNYLNNRPKTSLEFGIEHRNQILSASNIFRYYVPIEGYYLQNKYIELKFPVFGSNSDSVFSDYQF